MALLKMKMINMLPLAILFTVISAITVGFFWALTHAKNNKKHALSVEVVIIKEQSGRIWRNFSGRLTAVDFVEIRPQASGLITDVRFKGGKIVNKGDILYVIDPRPYKAAVMKAKANLVTALNQKNLARKEYKRAKDLIITKMISHRIYDERTNASRVAKSTVDSAKAQVGSSKNRLSYAYVNAPISGRVSRTEITIGNLVSAGPNAPLLTSIVSSDSIYADFEIDEQTYLRHIQDISFNGAILQKRLSNFVCSEMT